VDAIRNFTEVYILGVTPSSAHISELSIKQIVTELLKM